MNVENLPTLVVIAPILIVVATIYVLAPIADLSRNWVRWGVAALIGAVVLRYLDWRLFVTVLPAYGSDFQIGWIWFCFIIEVLALADATILYFAFLRTTDRRNEADAHEARLRALPADALPPVDVLIATYNEPVEVLEKTIVGALSLDYPHVAVWVLDDGRRPWLKEFCEEKGAGYITRPDNLHAKAGNINHALRQTDAPFFVVLDADFVPQRNFLMRTMGFFDDPTIGIVQVPHAFYNHDPFQANLALRKSVPDDQRFFFEAIMPSRDAWDAAFCCGSNSVTRRSAMDEVGGGLPSGSITEDMLLSLALLRKGFVTRYVCERLAYGLAPESIKAFFVQRQRWARGAIQILFLPEGPLGKGMRFVHRLLFLPTHWLTQSLMLLMSIVTPIVFLWTDTPPLINVTIDSVLHFLVPMVLATVGGIHFYAQREYFPLAAQVLSTFQSFKILPTALLTLIKPHGHVFKVTPKGGSAVGDDYDRGILWSAAVLIVLTLGGMIINTIPEQRIVAQEALVPMVAVWGFVNVIVLFLVCMLSIQAPVLRSEERFEIVETVSLRGDNGSVVPAQSRDLSVTGAGVAVAPGLVEMLGIERGAEIQVSLSGVGAVRSTVVRCTDGFLGVNFDLPQSVERELLIRKLFTSGFDTTTVTASMWSVVGAMLHRIIAFKHITSSAATEEPAAAERPAEKLPAATLVIPPLRRAVSLAEIAAERGALAA